MLSMLTATEIANTLPNSKPSVVCQSVRLRFIWVRSKRLYHLFIQGLRLHVCQSPLEVTHLQVSRMPVGQEAAAGVGESIGDF